MVLHLAEQLEVPLRERNRLLLAAGYAPVYSAAPARRAELGPIKDALDQLLKSHEPFPAIVVDRGWNLVAANGAIADADRGRRRRTCSNRRSTRCGSRCTPRAWRRGSPTSASGARTSCATSPRRSTRPATMTLRRALRGARGLSRAGRRARRARRVRPARDRRPERSSAPARRSRTAVDVTVSELAIESFFPADEQTAQGDSRRVEVTLEQIEPVGPVAAVGREPAVDLGQRRRIEPVPAPLGVHPHPHQPRVAQHPQVLGDARLAEPELARPARRRERSRSRSRSRIRRRERVGQDVEDLPRTIQYDR